MDRSGYFKRPCAVARGQVHPWILHSMVLPKSQPMRACMDTVWTLPPLQHTHLCRGGWERGVREGGFRGLGLRLERFGRGGYRECGFLCNATWTLLSVMILDVNYPLVSHYYIKTFHYEIFFIINIKTNYILNSCKGWPVFFSIRGHQSYIVKCSITYFFSSKLVSCKVVYLCIKGTRLIEKCSLIIASDWAWGLLMLYQGY